MVSAALAEAQSSASDLGRVGVLTTSGTRAARLYERAGTILGLDVLAVPLHEQHVIDAAIRAVKMGQTDLSEARRSIDTAVERLRSDGAQVVVAACTEIPLLIGDIDLALPVIDSASSLVDVALHKLGRGNAGNE